MLCSEILINVCVFSNIISLSDFTYSFRYSFDSGGLLLSSIDVAFIWDSTGGMGGWGGQHVSPAIPYADILLPTLNYTLPSFNQI